MDAQATFSCSFTQSDLDPVVELPQPPSLAGPEAAYPRSGRIWLSKSLAGGSTESADLAREHRGQPQVPLSASSTPPETLLTRAFNPEPKDRGCSSFTCRSPSRGYGNWSSALVFVWPQFRTRGRGRAVSRPLRSAEIALGTVHNVVHGAVHSC